MTIYRWLIEMIRPSQMFTELNPVQCFLTQNASGKAAAQQDIITTNTKHLLTEQPWKLEYNMVEAIWQLTHNCQSHADAWKITHLHSWISCRIVHVPWNTTGGDYAYLFTTFLSSHVSAHCLWLCPKQNKTVCDYVWPQAEPIFSPLLYLSSSCWE